MTFRTRICMALICHVDNTAFRTGDTVITDGQFCEILLLDFLWSYSATWCADTSYINIYYAALWIASFSSFVCLISDIKTRRKSYSKLKMERNVPHLNLWTNLKVKRWKVNDKGQHNAVKIWSTSCTWGAIKMNILQEIVPHTCHIMCDRLSVQQELITQENDLNWTESVESSNLVRRFLFISSVTVDMQS